MRRGRHLFQIKSHKRLHLLDHRKNELSVVKFTSESLKINENSSRKATSSFGTLDWIINDHNNNYRNLRFRTSTVTKLKIDFGLWATADIS